MTDNHQISLEDVQAALADALAHEKNKRGIRHASTFRSLVFDQTGISERTMKNYDSGLSAPIDPRMITLMSYFGAGFTNRILALAGHGHAIDLDIVDDAPNGFKMQAALAKGMNELATALADAILDHREMATLAPRCRDLGTRLIEFAAQCESTVQARRNT